MIDQYFAGKTAIVTGAGRGMGRAHAAALAAAGVRVMVSDINGESAERAAAEISRAHGVEAFHHATDVANEASVSDLFSHVERRFGRLDFLINNAALLLDIPVPFKDFWEIEHSEWRRMMDVNVGGVFLCTKAAFPLMSRTGGGRVVNISSDAIYKGYESQLHYFASKGAVTVMTRNLARELGPYKINVNAVAPGYTKTESAAASKEMQSVEPLILKSQCIDVIQVAEDVAAGVLFLCGPGASTITGQSLVINCGAVMP
jgi:3-oxoacyl-[acyl-carrier protein] reductase